MTEQEKIQFLTLQAKEIFMTKEQRIHQLYEQFKATGLTEDMALDYAKTQADNEAYADFAEIVRGVFIGESE